MPGENSDSKMIIRDVSDITRLFVRTLKELSEKGESLSFSRLADRLSGCEELKNLIDLANDRRETLTQPILEEEIKRLSADIEAKEEERKKAANNFFRAENDLDREKDFNKRLIISLLNLAKTTQNTHCSAVLAEFRDMMAEDAPLGEREDALSQLRNRIVKIELSRDVEKSDGRTTLTGKVAASGSSDFLNQLKKAAEKSLVDLHSIIGKKYNDKLQSIRNRIGESDDIDYILSQRKPILDIIEDFSEHIEEEKELITGFIQEIGDRLNSLEKNLEETSTTTESQLKEDLKYHDSLASDISEVRETVHKNDSFDILKTEVLTHLDKISNALNRKREEYVIRIQDKSDDHGKIREHFKHIILSLKDKNRILLEQSTRDPLTGIYNRRAFKERLTVEFERFRRYKTSFSVIFFDIDFFKSVNDTYGHDAGDRALKGIAQSTSAILRKVDVFARYGGEEFVVILYETDIVRATTVAEKIRGLIKSTEFEYKGQIVPITISVGVSTSYEDDDNPDAVVNRADKNLYRAKRAGRNRVISDLDSKE